MTVPEEMAAEVASKKAEREALRGVIQQWNANRLDLFELSEPNEDLEFHGVMRFYFQDSGQKVATKCIRVASDATTQAVIETLIEKFRPDMRMLSVPEYALYEIHENGEERKLGLEEKPLLVQLNWHIDDREGRFLLRRIDDKTNAQGVGFAEGTSFRRKLSKREKKQMKKQEKLSRLKSLGATSTGPEQDENATPVDQNGFAEKLYTELPETRFTRSISNPEAVMSRRRQQKLEQKLKQFRSKDGGPDTGGTLKIYGEALCKDVPYKTLLLSIRDTAAQVVREMLAKYGLEKVDPLQYCLVQVNGENANGKAHQEYILDDDECPLAILMNHPSTRGSIMFHVRRRPADYVPRKRKKKPSGKWNELEHRYEDERLPFLQELNPDGTDIANGAGARYRLQPNVTEVGSERLTGGPQAVQTQTITLTGPTVMPRHCVVAFTENIVTVTPCSRDAHTFVNNQRIQQTTILQNGAIIKFGRMHTFRFIDPAPEERIRQRHDSNRQIDYGYDRRSPDSSSQQELGSSDKYRPGTGMATPNGAVTLDSNPPSPNKSQAPAPTATARSPTTNAAAGQPPTDLPTHNYETTFDLDGNVETASLSSSSRDGHRLSHYERQQQQQQQQQHQPRGTDPILPAVLEFLEETEEAFLHAVITDVEPSAPQFKLAPTYTLYLAARYRASTHYRPELQPTERAHRLTVMLAKVATMIQQVIQERYMDASSLALWLANGSELLHMLKNDRHVGAFSTHAQDILAEAVHTAFDSLVRCISLELAPAMSQFMADADEPAKEAGVLQIFSNSMALLRRCRVNAALTIQLFSHLFHTINATAFNALISNSNLCVRWFGRRLKARLNALETWAERQGLELASQCHLATIMQATHLLQAPKYNSEELSMLSSSCFKLNSLQVRALLQKYQPAADEPRLPAELIEEVVRVAQNIADSLAITDGREIRLEEDPTLNLTLLLPEDGYSCEVIRGVPPGLAEFLAPLQRDGLCRMAAQPTSSGYWTIYMIDHHNFRSPSAMSNRSGGFSGHVSQFQNQPEIQLIKLHKSTNGMGLSIVAAKGAGQDKLGIYIKSVVAGGAADADGRLSAGDQLLKVDGQSLVGITQEKAAEYLVRTGPVVTLEVAKQGAIYHGLATLLSQPSPTISRTNSKSRPKSEHLDPSRLTEKAAGQVSSHSVGNLLTIQPRHSVGQVYHEQYVDSWEPQPGASMPRVNSSIVVPQNRVDRAQFIYRDYATAANYALQSYSTSCPQHATARPNSLIADSWARNASDSSPGSGRVPYVPTTRDEAAPQLPLSEGGSAGYWIDRGGGEKSRLIVPVIQEPASNDGALATGTPHRCAECFASRGYCVHTMGVGCAQTDRTPAQYQRQRAALSTCASCAPYAPQWGYYSDDKSELVFPAETSCSQGYLVYRDDYIDLAAIPPPPDVPSSRADQEARQEPISCASSGTDRDSSSLAKTEATAEEDEEEEEKTAASNDVEENDEGKAAGNRDTSDSPSLETEVTVISTPKLHELIPELSLDLSALSDGSDVSCSEAEDEPETTKKNNWNLSEEEEEGKGKDIRRRSSGRVAALARHFSQLGEEAGLIKSKSRKSMMASRRYASESDIASPLSAADSKDGRVRVGIDQKFKSESELLDRSDRSDAATSGNEWSTIFLDIKAQGSLLERRGSDGEGEKGKASRKRGEYILGMSLGGGKSSRLTMSEREQIIEQLKEFTNLDNADAPLFISDVGRDGCRDESCGEKEKEEEEEEDEEEEKEGSSSGDGGALLKTMPHRTLISGSLRLEHFRNHSLPAILKEFGSQDHNDQRVHRSKTGETLPSEIKINSLSKYWSLKDLASSSDELNSSHVSVDDVTAAAAAAVAAAAGNVYNPGTGKPAAYPGCSRVASAPEISDGRDEQLAPEGSIRIRSRIFIGARKLSSDVNARLSKSTSNIPKDDSEREECRSQANEKCSAKIYGRSKSWEKLSARSCSKKCRAACFDDADDALVAQGIDSGSSGNSSSGRIRSKSDLDLVDRQPTPRFDLTHQHHQHHHHHHQQQRQRQWPSNPLQGQRHVHDFGDYRPRRMSERDLPSRLGQEPPTHQQIHSSKSVPALHNVGTEGKLQHEIFNPGYSRASSSNSVTPPVQPPPPPMPTINGATSLRSRSSHNLHDISRAGTLPPSGLTNRQQSSPNLNPAHPSLQNNEAERFYQNLSVYRNQEPTLKRQPSPPQSSDDRSQLHLQKTLSRGSESSLNRGLGDVTQGRDRPISAYVSHGQQSNQQQLQQQQQPQQQQGLPIRSQSSRDIIRQEAKLQEMQEEVRRRELRGGPALSMMGAQMSAYRSNTYNPRLGPNGMMQQQHSANRTNRPLGSTPNLGPASPNYAARQPGLNYGYIPDSAQQCHQYGQFNKLAEQTYGSGASSRAYSQTGPPYASNGPESSPVEGDSMNDNAPARPALPQASGCTPPPPVPNTLTHPLFTKQLDVSSRYTASVNDPPRGGYYPTPNSTQQQQQQQQTRQYQFSATNPWQREEREKEQARRREAARQWRDQQIAELSALPRRTPQQEEQLRALQLERDFQKRAEEAASQEQDEDEEEEDEGDNNTNNKNNNNDNGDDDKSNDPENESTTQRVQGLLRTAVAQDRGNQMLAPTLSRGSASNQSGRGVLSPPQSVGSQIQMTNVPIHTVSSQQGILGHQNDTTSNSLIGSSYAHQQQQSMMLSDNNVGQLAPSGSSNVIGLSSASQKASIEAQINEDRDRHRRLDELKRRQAEFDESQRRRQEEEARQQQHQQLLNYQQQHHHLHNSNNNNNNNNNSNMRNQQQLLLHSGMPRLDHLIIEEPNSPNSQSGNEAPPPPERGSSYAVMSQQSALRSNNSTTSNPLLGTTKRVSFIDPNANMDSSTRNNNNNNINNNSNSSNIVTSSSIAMDIIREDPNNFINDAEMLLASPKTPDGPGSMFQGATPGVIGAQEVYKDPRQKRLAEKQKQQQTVQAVPEKLSFKEKMKMFAMETGEDGTPRDKVKISRAQREIDNIGSPLNANSGNNNNNNNNINNSNNNS